MDSEEMTKYGNKKFAIGFNCGAKREREKLEAECQKLKRKQKALNVAANSEHKRRARERRKKWYWKNRVFSVRTVVAVASSVVILKAIELLSMQFGR
jgi:hypothetical protein